MRTTSSGSSAAWSAAEGGADPDLEFGAGAARVAFGAYAAGLGQHLVGLLAQFREAVRVARGQRQQHQLETGERVLDVCSKSGASAVPAVIKVGSRGTQLGHPDVQPLGADDVIPARAWARAAGARPKITEEARQVARPRDAGCGRGFVVELERRLSDAALTRP